MFWLRGGVVVVEESLLGILKMECLTFYLILEIRNSKNGSAPKDNKQT